MNKYLAVYGKPRYLGIISTDKELKQKDIVVVESVRGDDIAFVAGSLNNEQEAEYRALRNTVERAENAPKVSEPAVTDLKFVKFAENRELNELGLYKVEEREILKKVKELVVPHELDIKLIDVEILNGRKKLFVYFSSEQRVDFRAFVRDLAKEFKTRIELRQIGVRDESKIIGGLGICGNPCCCSFWLHQFEPVGIKMVKEQNLALNPSKISGICGRLMCCMCYEHNVYSELWEGLPAPGSKLKGPENSAQITGINIGAKALKCYIPGLGEKDVPIDKFDQFKKAVEEGTVNDELENLVKMEDPVSDFLFDGTVDKIFKEHAVKEETDGKNSEEYHSRHKARFSRHSQPKQTDTAVRQKSGGETAHAEDYFADDSEIEEKQQKKHFRYHHRGGRKHRGKQQNGGGEA
ncbi:MAG: regulatory iron-sulfur-containing complex subunit RicT [Synergistaceae bacterium]|nr:regulatory iron-sulfur-containing complex subunit RicT [Synergistaceae bacterium]